MFPRYYINFWNSGLGVKLASPVPRVAPVLHYLWVRPIPSGIHFQNWIKIRLFFFVVCCNFIFRVLVFFGCTLCFSELHCDCCELLFFFVSKLMPFAQTITFGLAQPGKEAVRVQLRPAKGVTKEKKKIRPSRGIPGRPARVHHARTRKAFLDTNDWEMWQTHDIHPYCTVSACIQKAKCSQGGMISALHGSWSDCITWMKKSYSMRRETLQESRMDGIENNRAW